MTGARRLNDHSSLTLSAPIRIRRQGSAQAVLGVFEKLKAVGLVTLTIDQQLTPAVVIPVEDVEDVAHPAEVEIEMLEFGGSQEVRGTGLDLRMPLRLRL